LIFAEADNPAQLIQNIISFPAIFERYNNRTTDHSNAEEAFKYEDPVLMNPE
jgi:hypothetical protein